MMTTDTFSENSLAALADALTDPERIASAKREQHQRREAQAAQARDAALRKQGPLLANQAAAEKQLNKALDEMRTVEALLEQRRKAVMAAEEARRSAVSAVATLQREISLVHGGASVDMALFRLNQAIAAQNQKIGFLEANQWDLKHAADGVTVVWRSIKPTEAAKLPPAKGVLEQLHKARDAAFALQAAQGVSPASIRRKTVEILEPLGIPCDDLLQQPNAR